MTYPFSLYKIRLHIVIILSCSGSIIYAQSTQQLNEATRSFISEKKYNDALDYVNKSLNEDSLNIETLILKARIQMHLKQNREVVKICYAVLKLSPGNPEAYILRGDLAIVSKSYGTAQQFYNKALDNTQDKKLQFEIYRKKGLANVYNREYSSAHSYFLKAYDINQQDTSILYPLSKVLLSLENYTEAMHVANKINAKFPNDPGSHLLIGEIYQAQGDLLKSIEYYNNTIELDKNVIHAHLKLCSAYLQLKKVDDAIKHSNNAIALAPQEPLCFNYKGLAYIQKREMEQACNNIFKALQLGYIEKYGKDILEVYIRECEN